MTEEQIRELAYTIYLWRKDRGIEGIPEEDWQNAEKRLRIQEQISPRFKYFEDGESEC